MSHRSIPKNDPRRALWGQRLKDARQARGLTQDAAAALLGVSRTYLSNLESGYRLESWPTWLEMITSLGYDLRTVAPELFPAGLDKSTESFPTNPITSESTQHVDTTTSRQGMPTTKPEKI